MNSSKVIYAILSIIGTITLGLFINAVSDVTDNFKIKKWLGSLIVEKYNAEEDSLINRSQYILSDTQDGFCVLELYNSIPLKKTLDIAVIDFSQNLLNITFSDKLSYIFEKKKFDSKVVQLKKNNNLKSMALSDIKSENEFLLLVAYKIINFKIEKNDLKKKTNKIQTVFSVELEFNFNLKENFSKKTLKECLIINYGYGSSREEALNDAINRVFSIFEDTNIEK